MKPGSVRSSIACGLSALIASVSLSGCAGLPQINRTMSPEDLDHFVVDCSRRDEQIRFLTTQLVSADDRLLAWITNYFDIWGQLTNSDDYMLRASIAGQQTNWLVNQQILRIKHFCR